jgi:hypothetical protein
MELSIVLLLCIHTVGERWLYGCCGVATWILPGYIPLPACACVCEREREGERPGAVVGNEINNLISSFKECALV